MRCARILHLCQGLRTHSTRWVDVFLVSAGQFLGLYGRSPRNLRPLQCQGRVANHMNMNVGSLSLQLRKLLKAGFHFDYLRRKFWTTSFRLDRNSESLIDHRSPAHVGSYLCPPNLTEILPIVASHPRQFLRKTETLPSEEVCCSCPLRRIVDFMVIEKS